MSDAASPRHRIYTEVPPELEIDRGAFGGIMRPLTIAEHLDEIDKFLARKKAQAAPAQAGLSQAFMEALVSSFASGDSDDLEESEPDAEALLELAEKWVPDLPQCEIAQDLISNYDMRALTGGRILRDVFEDRIPEEGIDSLMAAMLVLGAENYSAVLRKMDGLTTQAVEEALEITVALDETGDAEEALDILRQGTPLGRLMLLAGAVADMEILLDNLNDDPGAAALPGVVEETGLAIRALVSKGDIDGKMVAAAVEQYNLTSEEAGIKLRLTANADNTVEISSAGKPPARKAKAPRPG